MISRIKTGVLDVGSKSEALCKSLAEGRKEKVTVAMNGKGIMAYAM